MRKLKTSDIPSFCRSLKKLGIKDTIRDLSQKSDNVADAWSKGFDLLWDIFDNATEVGGEKEIYNFFAGPFEMTPEEVADLSLPDFIEKIKTLAAENDLIGFFRSAASLTK